MIDDNVAVNPFVVKTPWMAQAACAGMGPEMFFPERGESTAAPKAVCAGCPVRVECLEYAMANGEKVGIWGGTSERERRRLRARGRSMTSLTDDQMALVEACAAEIREATNVGEATAWAVDLLRTEGIPAASARLAEALDVSPGVISNRLLTARRAS